MGIETAAIVVAAIGAAATTYGTVESRKAQKRQAGAQKEVQEISSAQQKNEQMQQQRDAIRQQRIRTAQIEQQAANAGASGSSGESGAVGGVATQTASNLAFGESAAKAAEGISAQNQIAGNAAMDAQLNQGIASLGGQALGLGFQLGAGSALFGTGESSAKAKQPVQPAQEKLF